MFNINLNVNSTNNSVDPGSSSAMSIDTSITSTNFFETYSMESEAESQGNAIHDLSLLVKRLIETPSDQDRMNLLQGEAFTNQIPKGLRYDVNTGLLAILFGDKIIKSSSLEGYSESEILKYILHVLSADSVLPHYKKSEIIEELKELLTLSNTLNTISNEMDAKNLVATLKQKISSLPIGGRILFPGGWRTSTDGHFIVFEMIRKSNNLFDFNLFNTGAGIRFHLHHFVHEKRHINPKFTILDVPTDRISSDAFLLHMIALNSSKFMGTGIYEADQESIYKKLIHILDSSYAINQEAELVTPQISGTCTFKALLAYLKNRLPFGVFNEFLYQIKYWSLANYTHSKKQCENYTEAKLLKKAAHGLANLGRKMYLRSSLIYTKTRSEDIERLLELSYLSERAYNLSQQIKIQVPIKLKDAIITSNFKLDDLDAIFQKSLLKSPVELSVSEEVVAIENVSAMHGIELKGIDDETPTTSLNQNIVKYFQDWLYYFSKGKTKLYILAIANLEMMLDSLPVSLNLSKLNLTEKKELFNAIVGLCLEYFNCNLRVNPFTSNTHMWHLFLILTQIWTEIQSNEMPFFNWGEYGFSFKIPNPSLDTYSIAACRELREQEKNLLIRSYAQAINQNKTKFLFDIPEAFSNKTGILLNENDYMQFDDLKFIKDFVESPYCHIDEKNTLCSIVVNNYAKQYAGGLPQSYYDLREVYLYCLFSNNCTQGYLPFPRYIEVVAEIAVLPNEEIKNIVNYRLEFRDKVSKHPLLIPSGFVILFGDWMDANNRFFSFGEVISTLTRAGETQNHIRSVSKSYLRNSLFLEPIQLFDMNVINDFNVVRNEFSQLSKYELNRIADILYAKEDRLYLALNYYLENPLLLEKETHLRFLSFIFYQFYSLYTSMGEYPQTPELINLFFKKLFSVYANHDKKHLGILKVLFSIALDYIYYKNDLDLLQYLKSESSKFYSYIKNGLLVGLESKEKIDFYFYILKSYSLLPFLPINEAALVVDVLMDFNALQIRSTMGCTVQPFASAWSKTTFPLLKRLRHFLDDERTLNELLSNVQFFKQNINPYQECRWVQNKEDKYKCSCQGWEFNLLKLTFFHPNRKTLEYILDKQIGHPESDCKTSIREIIGNSYSKLTFEEGVWINPERTIKLISFDNSYEVHELISDEWCRFSFCSQGIHQTMPVLPRSFDASSAPLSYNPMAFTDQKYNKESDKFKDIFSDRFHWYFPLNSTSVHFYGKKSQGEIIFKLERSQNGWCLENIKEGLNFGSLTNKVLPDPLNAIEHFPLVLRERMVLWLNKSSNEIQKLEFYNPCRSHLLMVIKKDKVAYRASGFEDLIICKNSIESPFNTLPPLLQLQHSNGKIFFLIPLSQINHEKTGVNTDSLLIQHVFSNNWLFASNENLNTNFEVSQRLEDWFCLFEFDENSGELNPKDLTCQIFLSYLYFVDQNYENAFSALQKCRQKTPYSEKQIRLFTAFYSYYNENKYTIQNPLQSAFLLHIQLLTLESGQFSSKKMDRFVFNNTKIKLNNLLIENYYNNWNAIPHRYRLTSKQESYIIPHIVDPSFLKSTVYPYEKAIQDTSETESDIDSIAIGYDSVRDFGIYLQRSACKDIVSGHPTGDFYFMNGKIEEVNFENFDYNTEISLIRNTSIEHLLNPHLENFNDNKVMALWMGLLSDIAEDSCLAKAKILFMKRNDYASLKDLFLKFAFSQVQDFKYYLHRNNIIIDWKQPSADAHLKIFVAWSGYIKENAKQILAPIKPANTPAFNTRLKRKSNRSFGSLLSSIPETSKRSLLPPFTKDIIKELKSLENDRIIFQKKYLSPSKYVRVSQLLTSYPSSIAQQMLDKLPLAKKLFEVYADAIDVQETQWNLINPRQTQIISILKTFLEAIQAKLCSLRTTSQSLKSTLEKEANATPLDHGEGLTIHELKHALENKINISSYQQEKITIQNLVTWALEQNFSSLNKRNSFLSPNDVDSIFMKLNEWMLWETEIELFSKAEKAINELQKELFEDSSINIESALETIGAILSTVRHYDVRKQPFLLAFEYLAKLILRKQQVEKIDQSLSSPKSHQIMKLMMGEGKTKVLLPLLSKMLAAHDNLPIVVAPYALYEEYIKNLKAVSEHSLMQNVYSFTFNRSSSTNISETNLILNMLKTALKEKAVLVLTAETIRSLFLKYQELLILEEDIRTHSLDSVGDIAERRIHLGSIINFIRKHSYALIDEGHLALKSLTEMNFTLTFREPLTEQEITTLLKIYTEMLSMPFDFSQPLNVTLSSEEHTNFIKERNHLIDRLYPNENERLIRAYLKDEEEGYYEQVLQINKELAAEIALVKEELWKLLPFTLSKALNHRYGRNTNNPEVEYAIPYIGAQKPSPLSEFGHKYVIINYTIQMHIQEGLTKHQFKIWIEKLKKRWIDLEVKVSEEEANDLQRKFLGTQSLKHLNLNDESVVHSLHSTFGKSQEIIFDYLKTTLLPGLHFDTKKLNSNEQDIGNFFFPNIIALSGTPYNAKTYPDPFQATLEEDNESDSDDELFKTTKNALELSEEEKKLVYALSLQKNQTYAHVSTDSSESALLAIRTIYESEKKLAAFVDLGAYFKDYSNLQTAKKILETLKDIEGVVFFDDLHNKLSLLKRNFEVPETYIPGKVPLKKLFAFFDNIHTFAADISLHEHAHAIISFNQESCLYELLQATKRMRKLEKSQSVSYLITKSLRNRIKQLIHPNKFDVGALYLYAILNEAKVLNKEIELSTTHQLKHQIKKSHLQRQLNSNRHLGSAAKILIENNEFRPSGYLSTKISPTLFFKKFCKQLAATSIISPTMQKNWNKIIRRAAKLLPKEMETEGSGDLNREIEKQEEKKIEQYVDSIKGFEPNCENSVLIGNYLFQPPLFCDIHSTFNNSDLIENIAYGLNDYFSFIENKHIQIFDSNILVTKNFVKTAKVLPPSWDIPIKPVDYFISLIYPMENQMQAVYHIIVSLQEMNFLKKYMKTMQFRNCYASLFSIKGELIAGDHYFNTNSPDFRRVLIQLQFFDGRNVYSRSDEVSLRQWVQGNESQLSDLFSKLHQNREKTDDFPSGNLFKILGEASDTHRKQITGYLQSLITPSQSSSSSATGIKRTYDDTTKEKEEDGMEVDTMPERERKRYKTTKN